MPYLNAYNMQIAQQLRNIDQNHINRIQAISETNEFDVRSPLESTALVNEYVHGGSGYSAATVMDIGFEQQRAQRQQQEDAFGAPDHVRTSQGQVCQVVEHLVAAHQVVVHQEVALVAAHY